MNEAGVTSAELGVPPAQERLERRGPLAVQDRQVDDLELVPLEGHPQAVEEQHALEGALAHLRGEEAVGVLAFLLRPVHREVGVAQQRVGVGAVVGVDADARARAERDLVVVGPAGPGEAVEEPPGHEGGVVGPGQVLHEDGELVAPDAGHEVGAARPGAQALGHRLQHRVAGGVAEPVVHRLEAVEVDEDEGAARALPPRARERALQGVEEERAVGEAGEAVVAGEALEVGLGPLPLEEEGEEAADVGEGRDPLGLPRARPLARAPRAPRAPARPPARAPRARPRRRRRAGPPTPRPRPRGCGGRGRRRAARAARAAGAAGGGPGQGRARAGRRPPPRAAPRCSRGRARARRARRARPPPATARR